MDSRNAVYSIVNEMLSHRDVEIVLDDSLLLKDQLGLSSLNVVSLIAKVSLRIGANSMGKKEKSLSHVSTLGDLVMFFQ